MFLAITACLFTAAVVYFILEYRAHEQRQVDLRSVSNVQSDLAATKKKLLGYTKYADHLQAAKKALVEQEKSLGCKVVREYVHVEKVPQVSEKPRPDAAVIVKYSVEFLFRSDLTPDRFEVIQTTSGIEVQMGKPVLVGAPVVKPLSYEIPGGCKLADEKGTVKEIYDALPSIAQKYSAPIAAEETTRASCKMKIQEQLTSFLAQQSGVTQFPSISVFYK